MMGLLVCCICCLFYVDFLFCFAGVTKNVVMVPTSLLEGFQLLVDLYHLHIKLYFSLLEILLLFCPIIILFFADFVASKHVL